MEEGKCFLCLKICYESCSHGHFYCCDDHLRAHGVGDYCFPFEIHESEEFGRYLCSFVITLYLYMYLFTYVFTSEVTNRVQEIGLSGTYVPGHQPKNGFKAS